MEAYPTWRYGAGCRTTISGFLSLPNQRPPFLVGVQLGGLGVHFRWRTRPRNWREVTRLNPRRVKLHRNYTVGEAAMLLDVHKNTVRSWLKLRIWSPSMIGGPSSSWAGSFPASSVPGASNRRQRCKAWPTLLHALPRTQDSRGARGRISADHGDIGKSERDLSRLRDAHVSLGLNAEAPKRCRRSASPSCRRESNV